MQARSPRKTAGEFADTGTTDVLDLTICQSIVYPHPKTLNTARCQCSRRAAVSSGTTAIPAGITIAEVLRCLVYYELP